MLACSMCRGFGNIASSDGRGAPCPLCQWGNARPQGCVCPPGAEKTCKGALCPRRERHVSEYSAR
jgi:hypothetical protein